MSELSYRQRVERTHRVVVAKDAWKCLHRHWRGEWHAAVLVGDRNVISAFGRHLEGLLRPLVRRLLVLEFPPGESSKNRRTKSRLEDEMLRHRLGRDTCLVAAGGGVSLDLGGFVAATYMRGIDSVYLPTTLLAQVDASVGGKTGVNTPAGKNLVGAFHHPRLVLVDPAVTASLPLRQWKQGLVELVKTAAVADERLFEQVERQARKIAAPCSLPAGLVEGAIRAKLGVVVRDERESSLRAVLNFGHTVGHAIERASGWKTAHGTAVAIGMAVESTLGERLGVSERGTANRVRRMLDRLELLPRRLPRPGKLLVHLRADKKRRRDSLRMPLLRRVGAAAKAAGREWTFEVSEGEIAKAIEDLCEHR